MQAETKGRLNLPGMVHDKDEITMKALSAVITV